MVRVAGVEWVVCCRWKKYTVACTRRPFTTMCMHHTYCQYKISPRWGSNTCHPRCSLTGSYCALSYLGGWVVLITSKLGVAPGDVEGHLNEGILAIGSRRVVNGKLQVDLILAELHLQDNACWDGAC